MTAECAKVGDFIAVMRCPAAIDAKVVAAFTSVPALSGVVTPRSLQGMGQALPSRVGPVSAA
jgi:hypothetical protein